MVALKALAAREAEGGGGVRLTDLGRAIGFPLSTLTAVVDRLERLGHVERLPSQRDRRSICVRSTERWQAVSQRLRRRVDAELASFLAVLPPERVARLAEDLAALVEAPRARPWEGRFPPAAVWIIAAALAAWGCSAGARRAGPAPVPVAVAEMDAGAREVVVTGAVVPPAMVRVAPKVVGRVAEVVVEVGQPVRAG